MTTVKGLEFRDQKGAVVFAAPLGIRPKLLPFLWQYSTVHFRSLNRKPNELCGGHTTCQENNPSSKSPGNSILQGSEKVLKCHSKDFLQSSLAILENLMSEKPKYTKETSSPNLEEKKRQVP